MKWFTCIIWLVGISVYGADLPILDEDTKILHIPLAEYKSGASVLYFRADLQASADFNSFIPVLAETVDNPLIGSGSSNIDLQGIDGTYTGVLAAFKPGTTEKIGPFSSCPPIPFNPGSTTVSIDSTVTSIEVSVDTFPDLICIMDGILMDDEVSGTFECSNFNKGNWSTRLMTKAIGTNVLIMEASYIGNKCSFDVNYTGLED